MSVGKRIKELRKQRNVNQTELAKAVNSSSAMLSMIESDKCGATNELIISLSMFFGVSTDYLLTGQDVKVSPVEREILSLIKEDSGLYKSLLDMLNSKKSVMNRIAA